VVRVAPIRQDALLNRCSTKPSHNNDSKGDETVEDGVQDRDCNHPENLAVSECPGRAQNVGQLVANESLPSTLSRIKQEHLSEATHDGDQDPGDARVNNGLPR
jgi:hypothetical protein